MRGKGPATNTLGFRWSAVNNLFVDAGDLGAEEWEARRDPDEENAEKKMLQFVWARPWEPPDVESVALDPEAIKRRLAGLKKGFVGADARYLTVGVDTGKRHCHWVATAWRPDAGGSIIDYGHFAVPSAEHGVQKGLQMALNEFREFLLRGWPKVGGATLTPHQVWIDSGWYEHTDAVYAFCRAANRAEPGRHERFRPIKGYGSGQQRFSLYTPPKGLGPQVRAIGENYHIARIRRAHVLLVHVNSDYWKSWLQQRLSTPAELPGALTLYDAMPSEHEEFVRQLTAERQTEEYVPGRGEVVVWERVRRANHYLDAAYTAAAAGHLCGARLTPEAEPVPVAAAERAGSTWYEEQRRGRGRKATRQRGNKAED